MKRVFVLALCVILSGCVSDRVAEGYRGQDAGYLVFSVAGIEQPHAVGFLYRMVGQPGGYRGFGGDGGIHYNPGNVFIPDHPDFTGHEVGEVRVVRLQPGDYEVYTWSSVRSNMIGEIDYGPAKDFSLPFTIKTGEATYIGEFAAAPPPPPHPAWHCCTYLVADRHERDLPIAKKKEPALPDAVTISVTDVSKLDEPSLVAD